jgi:hypothetical protein
MLLTSIKQFCVRFRSGDQAARRRPVQSLVVVVAALTVFLDGMAPARADFITFTGQPTFQTLETAGISPILNNITQPTLTQTYTTPAAGATNNTFELFPMGASAAASVDNGYNSSPSSLTEYVLLSGSAAAGIQPGVVGLYPFLSAYVTAGASLQGPTFTLNQPASAVLTFDPTLSLGNSDGYGGGLTELFADASVTLQGSNGSSMQISAEAQGADGFIDSSYLSAVTVTAGPSSIQTVYVGADSVEMNLAAGTYSISGSSGVNIDYSGGAAGNYFPSVNGGAELVLNALGGPPAPTPEPATFTLLSSGFFGFGGWRLWRKRRVA